MKENILVLSANEEIRTMLSGIAAEIAEELGFAGVSSGADSSVREKFAKNIGCEYGMAVIAAPLEDEYGLSLAAHICRNGNTAVIVITSAKNAEEAYKKIGDAGAFVLPKPVNRIMLVQTMRYMVSERNRRIACETENAELNAKMREIKMVDRAKCVLIQYLRISEPEAHRQIQKQAMDQRMPLVDVAMDILKAYEYI